jgi:hypothetical protein
MEALDRFEDARCHLEKLSGTPQSPRSGYCGQSPFGFQGVFSTIHGFDVS